MKKVICLIGLSIAMADMWGMPFENGKGYQKNNNLFEIKLSNQLLDRRKKLEDIIRKGRWSYWKNKLEHQASFMNILISSMVEQITDLSPEEAESVINYRSPDNRYRSFLSIAIDSGYCDTVEFFLSKGGEVNTQDEDGLTPLMLALISDVFSKQEKKAVVNSLLRAGASVNMKANDGKTVFNMTTDEDILSTLHEAKAKEDDEVVIRDAAEDILSMLREAKVKEESERVSGDATEDILSMLREAKVKSKDGGRKQGNASNPSKRNLKSNKGIGRGKGKRKRATIEDLKAMVQRNQKQDSKANSVSNQGESKSSKKKGVAVLQEQVKDPKWFEKITESDLAGIKKLFESNSEILHSRDKFGCSPLMWAIQNDKDDIALFFIEKSNDEEVTYRDTGGNTALMYAAKKGKEKIINALLSKVGAKAEYVVKANRNEESALTLAITNNHEKVVGSLLDNLSKAQKTEAMCFAIKNGYWNMAEIALKSGVEINHKDDKGNSPLILSLKTLERDENEVNQKFSFIEALIQSEAINLNAEDKDGNTALSYIVSTCKTTESITSNHKKIVKLLLERGVNIRRRDTDNVNRWESKANDQGITYFLRVVYSLQPPQLKGSKEKLPVKNEKREQRYKVMYKNGIMNNLKKEDVSSDVYKRIQEIVYELSVNPYPNRSGNGKWRLEDGTAVEGKNNRYGGAWGVSVDNRNRILYSIEKQDSGEIYPYIYNLYGHYKQIDQNHWSVKDMKNNGYFEGPVFPENPYNEEENLENSEKTLQPLDDETEVIYNEGLTSENSEIITEDDFKRASKGKEADADLSGESAPDFSEVYDQSRGIAEYLSRNNISVDQYALFLQGIMDKIQKK